MIHKQHGKFIFECDDCHKILETNAGTFNDAQIRRRAEEWAAVKQGDKWQHRCETCKELWREKV
jgi:hypothetical protein